MKYAINRGVFGIVFAITCTMALAQEGENLVPNGSFESTDGRTKKRGMIETATGWISPTGARADLFVSGRNAEIGVPENIYGKEKPKEGGNYAGIVAFSYGKKEPRTYLTTKLTTPLKKGMRYCIKFYVSLAEASKYASNNIGVNFSKKPASTSERVPQLVETFHFLGVDNDKKIVNQTYNWYQVCGSFEAKGGEKFITIGNFADEEKIKTIYESNKKPKDMKIDQIIAAYYYIDDISVIMLNKGEKCECVKEDVAEYSSTVYQKSILINDKMTINQKIEAQVTFFAFGKTLLTPVGNETLDFIAQQLKLDPAVKLEISGHSDAEEDTLGVEKPEFANMDDKRTNAVIQYLIDKGISKDRLVSSPQGSNIPNEENMEGDEEELKMARNRRVTFRVL